MSTKEETAAAGAKAREVEVTEVAELDVEQLDRVTGGTGFADPHVEADPVLGDPVLGDPLL